MPTYAYACPQCGHEYDRFQKISDDTRAKCPECGTRGERLISGGVGLVFKGSGFYITDYKRAGEKRDDKEKKKPKEEKTKSDGSVGVKGGSSDGGKKSDSSSSSRKGAES